MWHYLTFKLFTVLSYYGEGMRIELSFKDAVLAAIANGIDTIEELSKVFMVREEFVKKIVDELKNEGLIEEVEKGFWIFKRRVLRLTSKGLRVADRAIVRLKEIADEIKGKIRKEMSHDELREVLKPYMPIIPLLVYLNLLDLVLLDILFTMPLIAWWDADFIGGDETYLE